MITMYKLKGRFYWNYKVQWDVWCLGVMYDPHYPGGGMVSLLFIFGPFILRLIWRRKLETPRGIPTLGFLIAWATGNLDKYYGKDKDKKEK